MLNIFMRKTPSAYFKLPLDIFKDMWVPHEQSGTNIQKLVGQELKKREGVCRVFGPVLFNGNN